MDKEHIYSSTSTACNLNTSIVVTIYYYYSYCQVTNSINLRPIKKHKREG